MMLVTVAFLRAELNVHYTPGQHHGGERHGQAELDVVAALALHCAFVLGTVAEAGVAAPGHAVAQRQLAVAADAPSSAGQHRRLAPLQRHLPTLPHQALRASPRRRRRHDIICRPGRSGAEAVAGPGTRRRGRKQRHAPG